MVAPMKYPKSVIGECLSKSKKGVKMEKFSPAGEKEVTRAIVGEFAEQFNEYVESDCIIIGGVVGNWAFGALGISISDGILGDIITGAAGAVIVLFIAGLFKK